MSSTLGLFFTASCALILYLLYAIAFFEGFDNNDKNILQIIEAYGRYIFDFVNPTHRSDFIESATKLKAKQPALAGFIDLLGRVIIGFGIYQFIQSFRRYGKGD